MIGHAHGGVCRPRDGLGLPVFTGSVQPQRTPLTRRSVVAMVLRLAVFALMLGTLLYRFGPLAGVAALMGAAVTRGLMIWAEPRPRLGGR